MRVRSHPVVLIALLLTLASVLAGCGSEDGATDTDVTSSTTDSDGSSDGGGSDGTGGSGDGGSVSGGNSSLPPGVAEDFPFPITDGWVIDVNGQVGIVNPAAALLMYPGDDFDRLVAFYQQWTDDQGAEYAKTESAEFVVFSNLETGAMITINKDEEYGDEILTGLAIIDPSGTG